MRKKSRWFVRHPPRCFDIKVAVSTPVLNTDGTVFHIGRYICCGCLARCPVDLNINYTLPEKYREHALTLNEMYVKYAADYNAKNKNIKKENSK